MIKLYALFFSALCCAGSIYGQGDKIKISGKILHPTVEKVTISYINDRPIKMATLHDGNFELVFENKSGYYTFRHGNETAHLYLHPGDDIAISIDTENFDETITFKGKGSQRNNYLVKKSTHRHTSPKRY